MYINLVYDSSVTGSPYAANIMLAAQQAANLYNTTYSNPITVNITVGYGEQDGNPITGTTAAAQSTSNGDYFDYSTVKAALDVNALTAIDQIAVSTLPQSDPAGGGLGGGLLGSDDYYVTRAEQKALGLLGANDPGVDGNIGLSKSLTFFVNGQPGAIGNPGVSAGSQNDAVGALAHEISEVLGRVSGLGQFAQFFDNTFHPAEYTPLDLYRSFGPANRDLSPGPGRSFSFDNIHMLAPYDDSTASGHPDAGDWTVNVPGDSYGYNIEGTVAAVTPVDIAEMNVLGYQPDQQIIDVGISVSAGETVSAALVTSGGFLTVRAGGIVTQSVLSGDTHVSRLLAGGGYSSTTTENGTQITVSSGGFVSNVQLYDLGEMTVSGGGTAVGTTVLSGGLQFLDGTLGGSAVALAASAIHTIVENGGFAFVSGGGVSISAYVVSGGNQNVYSGGVASLTTIDGGGRLAIGGSGSAVAALINAGGTLLVNAGGFSDYGTLIGSETVWGVDSATTIIGAGSGQIVSSGGSTVEDTVSSGGTQIVSSGGTATGTVVGAGGSQTVHYGGATSSTMVISGGVETVLQSGTASGTDIGDGGFLTVSQGGFATSATVLSGGTLADLSSAMSSTVLAGGGLSILDPFAFASATVVNGGTENITEGLDYSAAVLSGGTQIVGSQGAAVSAGLLDGGTQDVRGAANDTSIAYGGAQFIFALGLVFGTRFAGGAQDILSGAEVAGASVSAGIQDVFSGGTADGTVLSALGIQGVYAGATVAGTVFSGGTQDVNSGAVVNGTSVSGGTQNVGDGGVASGTQLGPGGVMNVAPDGTASGTVVGSGGVETDSGLDLNAIVNDGGTLIVAGGGIASGTILNDPGTQIVAHNGTATDARVSGGIQDISGSASKTTVGSGGVANVSAGGTASTTTIGSAGAGFVFSGGVADDTTVLSGGVETIFTGGTASGTMVSSGGQEIVSSGGRASNDTVVPGGRLFALSGGAIAGGTVTGTGIETISASGSAIGDTVSSGGTQVDFGRTTGTTIGGGGDQAVSSGGFASAAILLAGGTQHVWSGATISGTYFSGGTQDVLSGAIVAGAAVGGGLQNVSAGGLTTATSVGGTGSQEVHGSASASILGNGGVQDVWKGGSVAGTVFDGGTQNVLSAAMVSGAFVVSGVQNVMSGGTTEATGVAFFDDFEFGLLNVFSGGVANDATVVGYLATAVLSGGTASNTSVGFGGPLFAHAGTLTVLSGGRAAGTVAYNDGYGVTTINVSSGGLASETTADNVQINVFSGGIATETTGSDNLITVGSGASVSGTVESGGGIVVSAGARSDDTTLSDGGYEAVAGSAANTTTFDRSVQIVSSGGFANGTMLLNVTSQVFMNTGQEVYAGGEAVSTLVSTSEQQIVSSGGVAIDTTLLTGDPLDTAGGWQVLSAGASATGTVVSNHARQYVLGATASETTVHGGGVEIVASNGMAISTSIGSGGTEVVDPGGSASFTVVSRGGSIDIPGLIYSGGGSAVVSGTALTVSEGGSSYRQQLSGLYTGEHFQVAEDGFNGTVITLDATPRTLAWTGAEGTDFAVAANWSDVTNAIDPALSAPDATDTVEFNTDGGAITGTNTVASVDVGLNGTGVLELSGGATLATGSLDTGVTAPDVGQIGLTGVGTALIVTGSATVADDGTGVLSVLSGARFAASSLTIGNQGDSSGALVVSGEGSLVQLSGALNIGTVLGTGDLTVGPNAAVNAAVVNLQGQEVIEGGVVDPTVQLIGQGQTAGGFGTISAGDIIDEGVIQAGQSKASQRRLLVRGTVVGGGTLTINGTVQPSKPAGVLQINAGGTMELTGAVLNAATTTFTDNLTPADTYTVTNAVMDVNFADAAGVLTLDDIAGFAGTIATWQAGDQFLISGGTLSGLSVSNGDTLQFSDSGAAAGPGGIDQIIFASPVNAAGFDIVNGDTVQVACFAAGTRIETSRGAVAVEDLTVGDQAVLAENVARTEPIVWIRQRLVNCEAHPSSRTVWPVRVAAGAFGPGRPVRDLWLSPDHAVFVNGMLVPVRLLVNGTAIAQVRRERVRYFHVELPRHAVILAEALPVESYLDIGDRANFDRDDETVRLFPDFTPTITGATAALLWEALGAAPLVMTGTRLEETRRAVMENAPWRRSAAGEQRRRRVPALTAASTG